MCFLVGFLVRSIPELLAFSSPIGFDTISYALAIRNGVVWSSWASFFTSSWLLFALTIPVHFLLNLDPFLLLKMLGPALFGLNVAGVFWFAKKMFGWSSFLSLGAAGFFALQLAALRISWDLLRNTLGLGLLLFALPLIYRLDSKRGFWGFLVLSLLTVFAHEYAAVILFGVVLGLVKKQVPAGWKRLTAGIVPSLGVFSVGMFLRLFPANSVVLSNVVEAGDFTSGSVGGIFFLVNYLRVRSALDYYWSYAGLALSVVVLFAVLYVPFLYLVLKGFFQNRVLCLWTALLLVGAFGCLISPFAAIEYWHRWMFMLVYPFTFYAMNGLRRIRFAHLPGSPIAITRGLSWKPKLMTLATIAIGIAYLASPLTMTYANSSVPSVSYTAAYFSTNPTVPYEDVESVGQVMRWLNSNMIAGDCVLLQRAFLEWGKLDLDNSHKIVYFEVDAEKAVNVALKRTFSRVLFVWWNVNIGWYGIVVPEGFERIHDFGRLSVFEYVGA